MTEAVKGPAGARLWGRMNKVPAGEAEHRYHIVVERWSAPGGRARGRPAVLCVSLCFRGDGLDPDKLTKLLRVEPTESFRKGDSVTRRGGTPVVHETGYWRLGSDAHDSALSEQVTEILSEIDAEALRSLPPSDDLEVYLDVFVSPSKDDVLALDLDGAAVMALEHAGIPLRILVYPGEWAGMDEPSTPAP